MLELDGQTSLDKGVNRRSRAILAALLLHTVLLGLAQMASEHLPPALLPPSAILVELDQPENPTHRKLNLLVSNRRHRETPQNPPKDSRYFSDRNRSVPDETRSKSASIADLSQLQSPFLRKKLSSSGQGIHENIPFVAQSRPGSEAQRPDDPSLSEGAENLLNTVESIHYSFYSRIYGSLAPVWQSMVRNSRPGRPLSPGSYRVVADLVLDSQGNLIGIEFHERSQVRQFDDAVIASASKVRKFPNPPHDLIAGKSEFRTLWSFTVNVGPNSLMDFAPPRRLD